MKNIIQAINQHLQAKNNSTYYLSIILFGSLVIHLLCMTQACLLVEEAYYWNYAQHLDFSYLDHPPMVALLIKLFTTLLGTSEFSVRVASLLCWCVTALFSYKLSEQFTPGSGKYALLSLAVLPFFFFQSIIITPDVPLITCWSASLYYLYGALHLNRARNWYWAGVWLGLGMLSKYTISLLGLTCFVYVLSLPPYRFWLRRKEPYIAILITVLLFTPVIYWNATHEWVSFIFQSSRRFSSLTSINTHHLIWIIFFFITPLGLYGLWELIRHNSTADKKTRTFSLFFTLIPLGFFILYSLNHEVNFNWTGPLFLALIPWLSFLIATKPATKALWIVNALSLLMIYSGLLLTVKYNHSEFVQRAILVKVIAWDTLIKQLNDVATQEERKEQRPVIFVALDNYPINSALAFYQTKLFNNQQISKIYPVLGAHIFQKDSLMYRYWATDEALNNKTLILVAKEKWRFENPSVTTQLKQHSALFTLWSVGQGQHVKAVPYYYQIVEKI